MSLFEIGKQDGTASGIALPVGASLAAVRLQALRLLDKAGDHAIQPQAERLLGDEDPEVRRLRLLRYLVAHAGRDPLTLLSRGSDLPAHVMQGAVVVFLARSGEPD